MFLPSAHTTEQILINPSLNGPIKKNNQIGKSFFLSRLIHTHSRLISGGMTTPLFAVPILILLS